MDLMEKLRELLSGPTKPNPQYQDELGEFKHTYRMQPWGADKPRAAANLMYGPVQGTEDYEKAGPWLPERPRPVSEPLEAVDAKSYGPEDLESVSIHERPGYIQRAIEFIKSKEGFKPTAYPDDKRGTPQRENAIGYGFQIDPRTNQPANFITAPMKEEDAELFMEKKLGDLNSRLDRMVQVPLAEGQRAALLSFMWNFGHKNLERSDLLEQLNEGDARSAAGQFLRWNKIGKEPVRGLTNRRKEEMDMFLEHLRKGGPRG